VREVRAQLTHRQNMLQDTITNGQVCQHCAAGEYYVYYATHYQFKAGVQLFDLVREPPMYLHISRADTDWLVSQHRRIEPSNAAVVPKKPTLEASLPLLRASSEWSSRQSTLTACGICCL